MAQIIPFPSGSVPIRANRSASEPCEPPKRHRKPRAKMRVEQHEVTCTKVPRKQHRDLCDLSGVLTLDFKGETP